METMAYNYFSPAPQPYSYMGFDAESGILPNDGLGATPVSLATPESTGPR